MLDSTSFGNPNRQNNPQAAATHYAAFTRIKHQFPGLEHGNRCGHRRNFQKLPALKKDGKPLKIKHFIRRVEHQIFCFFKQHYKVIFARCPELQAACGNNRLRTEAREAMTLVNQVIARNMDLTTMALDANRTVTELVRFANHALHHQQRRLSAERTFDHLRLLRDAGLIHYRIPSAEKIGEEWQAAPAEISFTNKFWHLLGISKTELQEQKNKAKHALTKKMTAGDKVAKRRFADKFAAAERAKRAQAARTASQQPQQPTADQPQPAAANPDDFAKVQRFFNQEFAAAVAAGNTNEAEQLKQEYQQLISNPAALAQAAHKLRRH